MSKYTDNFDMEASVDESPITTEEKQDFLAINENDILKALKGEDGHVEETKEIRCNYKNAVFTFRIRGLSEREYDSCREKCTKYQKNRRLGGMRLPEKTDTVGYHTLLIYTATVKEDREKLWDNKKLWEACNALTGTDLVEILIPAAGKKQSIVDEIERLSGFDDESEEAYNDAVKN